MMVALVLVWWLVYNTTDANIKIVKLQSDIDSLRLMEVELREDLNERQTVGPIKIF